MKIEVKVVSNAKKIKIEKLGAHKFKVYLTQKPQNNKANEQLLEILSEFLNIKKSNIKILKGLCSRQKLIEILEGN